MLKGLLNKLKCYGFEGDRKQRVVLNGQNSDRRKINSDVP